MTLAVLALGLVVLVFSFGSRCLPDHATPVSPTLSLIGNRSPASGATFADDETWLGAVELRSQDVVSAKGDLVDVVATGSGVRFSQAGLGAQR